ncbi:NAD(P)/FAD-dependent oxidoreductase [Solihabitans fulvus]|uniref:NAD(P)/FAD-dependent oxidoreductase n=1 Tax=Solihabitans fulvus TaxID=1892852 RepID=A0A5B2XI80_9PSEU|nr:NAD(P)/FAD-dependent oxidoreductase [Solihabitans fulvus]KAA2262699.1 NAD(P)/FAD-dependent oxidoreductase [Solihabitans fulvus]
MHFGTAAAEFDVVVIGAGLGGLSAAAACARAGRSVFVVDAQDGPGGYAHAFRRGPYRFDPAVHVTSLAHEGEVLYEYLRALGALDAVEFLDLDEFYGVELPGFRMRVPHGVDAFIEAHAERWPAQRAGIRAVVRLCQEVFEESQQLSTRTSWRDLDEAVRTSPLMFEHRLSTVDDVMDRFVTDGKARSALSALWPYMGVPPSRLTFTGFCSMLMSMVRRGPSYCRGGFQSLADALAGVVRAAGGLFRYGTRVTRIVIEGGRAAGVVLADGTLVRAGTVISNADATTTMHQLVGAQHLPANYVRRLGRLTPSWSAFVLFAATTLDLAELAPAHETFVFDHWDHDVSEAAIGQGQRGGMWLSVPSLVDPGMAPPGEHTVVFSTLARADCPRWGDRKVEFELGMLERLERLLPGITGTLTFLDSATPRTLCRYTGNQAGAIYGWENTPRQSQPKRLRCVTPLPGLLLAGHWTEPGAGSFRVILSGMQAAAVAIGAANQDDFVARLLVGAGSRP